MLGDLDIEGMSKGAAGDVSVMESGGRVTSMGVTIRLRLSLL